MSANRAGKSFQIHIFIITVIKYALEIYAKISGKRFYCSTLSGIYGNGNYNGTLTINSDSTLFCTCIDFDGSAKIGDLNTESMDQILNGTRVKHFKAQLARGILPSIWCTHCAARKIIPSHDAQSFVTKSPDKIKQLGIENTALCNYACTTCDRSSVYANRKKTKMSLDEMEKISVMASEKGLEKVIFANLGEPFLSSNLEQELQVLRKHNPGIFIETSTNGSVVDSDAKRKAALNFDRIYFSIDGISQAQIDKYQKKGSFDRAYENMKKMVAYRNERKQWGLQIYWRYVVFNWNDKQSDIEAAMRMAAEAGIDEIEFSFSIRPFYGISWRYLLSKHWIEMRGSSTSGVVGRRILRVKSTA